MGIIKTLADIDLYKMTMGHFVNQHFSEADVTYSLNVRSKVEWAESDIVNIRSEINSLKDISFSNEELKFIQERCKYLPKHYVTFLNGFKLDPSNVIVRFENGNLNITARGIWGEEIYWETLLMAIISECFFEERAPLTNIQLDEAYNKAKLKAKKFRSMGAYFIDMGTRRRRSLLAHDAVIQGLQEGGKEFFLGTSNVHFAQKYNLTSHGTMAHELFSGGAAMYGVENANNVILGKWVDTYHGLLGIALPDTFTTDFFLKAFNPFYTKLYDGIRHDSGDPKAWFDRFDQHYKTLGIDNKVKKAVFSDGIDSFERMKDIKDYVDGRMLTTFGIGTWLTNDFEDMKPLNMVFKLVEAQKNSFEPRRYAVKLSDVPSKHNGDEITVIDYKTRISTSLV